MERKLFGKLACTLTWILTSTIILYMAVSEHGLLQPYIDKNNKASVISDAIRLRSLGEFNIAEDVNIRNMCMTIINEEEILKSAWPPKAVPGDEERLTSNCSSFSHIKSLMMKVDLGPPGGCVMIVFIYVLVTIAVIVSILHLVSQALKKNSRFPWRTVGITSITHLVSQAAKKNIPFPERTVGITSILHLVSQAAKKNIPFPERNVGIISILHLVSQAAKKNIPSPKRTASYGGKGMYVNRSLLSEREMKIYDLGMSNYKVNQIASERIPMRRDITLNMPECQNLTYDTSTLPMAGVVLIFHDEMWSALMRTVFSILDAGPSHLITEIVLVDDASQRGPIGKPLDDYIRIFHGKVKVVRMPERKGLIAARLVGFEYVTGEVAVFLDGHCEVAKGWLEPLLHRIKQDDSVVAVPQTDVLKWNTFEYQFTNNKDHAKCGFEFDMRYSWIRVPLPDGIKRKSFADPIETATHMGCCFATSKKNFERLGGYDPDLEIWGCENLELSFKTWMCHGRLEIIPCSHIAHMYRPSFPYSWGGKPYIYERNCLRVAEVWMDQYKEFYSDRISNLQNEIDIGDVSQRKALREKLKCRSFDWYVKEIHPDIYLPINTTALGKITSKRYSTMCITTDLQSNNKNSPAHPEQCGTYREDQYYYLTKERQIRRDNECIFLDTAQQSLKVKRCNKDKGQWEYKHDSTIELLGTNKCLTISSDNKKIVLALCNSSDTSQQWSWPRRSLVL